LRHFYSGHPWLADDVKERGIDELNPIGMLLDLTPQGRGSWYASLEYGMKVQAARAEEEAPKRQRARVAKRPADAAMSG